MEAYYTIDFTYPDGHVETLFQEFATRRDAQDFGFNMLNQVAATERFHGGESVIDPYFIIIKPEGKTRVTVYDSRARYKAVR